MTEKQSVLISAMRYEAKDILSVEMVSAQGKNLVQFSAGGHIDVFFREGLVRQYSLINDPEEKIATNLQFCWRSRAAVDQLLSTSRFVWVTL
ncbi:MAG: hypothetical protein CM15mP95_0560 [Alphaproteobacteria bacterium]|nr:MAG: hypothetical protein CM15mP95_0560 [Alphaproteobacteria bacterium]